MLPYAREGAAPRARGGIGDSKPGEGRLQGRLKLLAIVSGVVVGGGIAAVVLVLGGRDASGPPLVRVATPGFPAPPLGAVVFSRRLGADALALGVLPQSRGVLLQASVVGTQGWGVSGLDVRFAVAAAAKGASPCGAGCYRATLPTGGRPRMVSVRVGASRWRVALPDRWPPQDASALVARAAGTWRSLRSLVFHEVLASDARAPLQSDWRVQAPDRVAYQVRRGWAGVVIGSRRWDRPPGGKRWQESAQTPVTQPSPGWTSATDAYVLGKGTLRGRPVWRVSFFDPGTPAWFALAIDRRTFRTLDVRMIATAHFMHDAYGSFNRAQPITTPAQPRRT